MSLYNGANWQSLYQGIDAIRDQQNRFMAADERDAARKQQQANADRTYELAKARATQGQQRPWWAGPGGQVDPSMLAYRAAGRPQTNVNVNAGNQREVSSFWKKYGEQAGTDFNATLKSANAARGMLRNLDTMESIVRSPNLYQGTGGESVNRFKKMLSTTFGVDAQGVTAYEMMTNLTKELGLEQKGKLPGTLSNSDVKLLLSLPPNVGNTPEGNLAIINLLRTQNEYQIAKARAMREYVMKNRNDPNFSAVDMSTVVDSVDKQFAPRFKSLLKDRERMATRSMGAGLPDWIKGAPDSIVQRFRTAPAGTRFKSPDGQTYIKE